VARKKPTDNTYVLFNVVYEDGSLSSNRKIASAELLGPEGDAPAKWLIETQDRKIAEMSGNAPRVIKRVAKSA